MIIELTLASIVSFASPMCGGPGRNLSDAEEFQRLRIVLTDHYGSFSDPAAADQLMLDLAREEDCDSRADQEVFEYAYALSDGDDPTSMIVMALAMCPAQRWNEVALVHIAAASGALTIPDVAEALARVDALLGPCPEPAAQ